MPLLLLPKGRAGGPVVEPATGAGSYDGKSRKRGNIVREALDWSPKESDRARAERIAALLDAPTVEKTSKGAVAAPVGVVEAVAFDAAASLADATISAAQGDFAAARALWARAIEIEAATLRDQQRQTEALAAIYAAAEAYKARLHEEDELIIAAIVARG